MALYRCGGGGGMLEETVLWTNPSPTSDFAAQTVTLSDSISNYDYIKFEYLMHKSYLNKSSAIYKSEDVLNWMTASQGTNYTAYGILGGRTTADQKRSLLHTGTDSVYINNSLGYNSTTGSNSNLVPTTITGLKFSNRRPSSPQVAIGSFTPSTTADVDVVIGFKPKYLCVTTAATNAAMYTVTYNEDISSSKQVMGAKSSSSNSAAIEDVPYTGTSTGRIRKLNDDGFTYSKGVNTTYGTIAHYFAIG